MGLPPMSMAELEAGPSKIGICALPPVPEKWSAHLIADAAWDSFLLSTRLTEYITTKNAKSRVMKSAYDTSQRSWFSCSSSCFLFLIV